MSASAAAGSDGSDGVAPASAVSWIDVGADSDSGAGRFQGSRHCSRRVRTGAAAAATPVASAGLASAALDDRFAGMVLLERDAGGDGGGGGGDDERDEQAARSARLVGW